MWNNLNKKCLTFIFTIVLIANSCKEKGLNPDEEKDINEIHLFNLNENKDTVITQGINPTFTPDGSKIVFFEDSSLNIININGSNKKQLLKINNEIKGFGNDLTVSPDGSKIVFVVNHFYGYLPHDIYCMDIDGSNLKKLTDGTIKGRSRINFAPAGNIIVYIENGNIITLNIDNNERILLKGVNNLSSFYFPYFLDNNKILFYESYYSNIGNRLQIVNTSNNKEDTIVSNIYVNSVSTSIKNKFVYSGGKEKGSMAINLIDIGSNRQTVIGYGEMPIISPDGQFVSHNNSFSIFMINLDSLKVREIFRETSIHFKDGAKFSYNNKYLLFTISKKVIIRN